MHHPDTLAVMQYLGHLEFPVTKQDLIATAAANGAPQQTIEALQAVEGERFESELAVIEALR